MNCHPGLRAGVQSVVVWMPDMIELWERVSGDEEEEQWEQVAEYPNTLGKIPLVTIYANRNPVRYLKCLDCQWRFKSVELGSTDD